MRRNHRIFTTLVAACGAAAIGCGPATTSPDVTFGSSNAVGPWDEELSEGESASTTGTEIATGTGTTGVANGGKVVPSTLSTATAGRSATVETIPENLGGSGGTAQVSADAAGAEPTGTGSADDAGGAGGAGGAAAEPTSAGGPAPEPAADSGVTSLRFEVTTSAAGGRYQPKNVGAIWVEDASGGFVKSLEVWAASRRRYLTGYLGAQGGGTIDVATSATLRSHQTHTVTWDLKDRDGAAVPPGAYRLMMELTDANTKGKSNTVDFDTSAGPVTLSPADAPSFGGMKLELQ